MDIIAGFKPKWMKGWTSTTFKNFNNINGPERLEIDKYAIQLMSYLICKQKNVSQKNKKTKFISTRRGVSGFLQKTMHMKNAERYHHHAMIWKKDYPNQCSIFKIQNQN
ncbi:hypothetical protein M0811_01906 [Anaeramoeba ignava]|uniref:Uncharacterized protein n=1 Tax=Anaeramoeba ignava TaxID=1746090 RepID=A0A9Q0LGR3_ANAIG|nr:hypothetical protein M0811_01906 [Anaeramoeba ignava]